jgi:hypothetical protein
MVVAPGAPLGTVGNTGSVIADKGDGSHLDLKFKVNGEKMDIMKRFTEKYRTRLATEDELADSYLFPSADRGE